MKTTNIAISIDYLDTEDAKNKKDDIIDFLRKNPKLFLRKDWEIYNTLNEHFDFLKGVNYKIDDPNSIICEYFGASEMEILDFQENVEFVAAVLDIVSQERKKWNEKKS